MTGICQGKGLAKSILGDVVEMKVPKFDAWLLDVVKTTSNRRRWQKLLS